jgi:hypothetical protein
MDPIRNRPAELRPLAFHDQALVYELLFEAAAGVLQHLAAERMGGRLGVAPVDAGEREPVGETCPSCEAHLGAPRGKRSGRGVAITTGERGFSP